MNTADRIHRHLDNVRSGDPGVTWLFVALESVVDPTFAKLMECQAHTVAALQKRNALRRVLNSLGPYSPGTDALPDSR